MSTSYLGFSYIGYMNNTSAKSYCINYTYNKIPTQHYIGVKSMHN
jgi:hypothetical protein